MIGILDLHIETYIIVSDRHRCIDDSSTQFCLIYLENTGKFYTKYVQLHTEASMKKQNLKNWFRIWLLILHKYGKFA